MERFLWVVLLLLVCMGLQAKVYKWTDSKGDVHYGDSPHKGSEEVTVPEVQTFSSPPQADPNNTPYSEEQKQTDENVPSSGYKEVTIVQPEPESTIRNNQGMITVLVVVDPALRPGHRLQMIYDGEPLGKPQATTFFGINNAFRGTHTISVNVVDEDGNVLASSEPVTFYVHRPRILSSKTSKLLTPDPQQSSLDGGPKGHNPG